MRGHLFERSFGGAGLPVQEVDCCWLCDLHGGAFGIQGMTYSWRGVRCGVCRQQLLGEDRSWWRSSRAL